MLQVWNANTDNEAKHDEVNSADDGIGQRDEEGRELAEKAEDEEDQGGGLDHSSGSAAGDWEGWNVFLIQISKYKI